MNKMDCNEKKIKYLPEHLSSPPVFSGVRVTRSLVFSEGSCYSIFSFLCSVLQIVVCPFLFWPLYFLSFHLWNRNGDVMFGVHASSAVDRGFESRSGQTKDYKIGICCFSAKHAALRRKSKDWLAQNQNNVSEWSDMSTLGLLFQCAASTINIQLSMLVQYKVDIIITSLIINSP